MEPMADRRAPHDAGVAGAMSGVARGREPRFLCALGACAFILMVSGDLCGCAVYDAYRKCGLRGCPGDANITAEVRAQLHQSSFLEPYAIRVQTLDRVVFLEGVVTSGLEIDTADSIARNVPGVARVVNSIVVSTSR